MSRSFRHAHADDRIREPRPRPKGNRSAQLLVALAEYQDDARHRAHVEALALQAEARRVAGL